MCSRSVLLALSRSARALVVCGVLLSTLQACSGFFYFPSRQLYRWPERPFKVVTLPTEDGLPLDGWLFEPRGATRGTVVQFHGNAANMTNHYTALEWVVDHELALLVFDYRGYGRPPGRASAAGLELDARAAIRFAQALPHGSWRRDLVLVGQSLGGAVLLSSFGKLQNRERVRALVVEGTFHSYTDMAASVLWQSGLLLPLTGLAYSLVSDEYSPSPWIAWVSPTPLLVVHGTRDGVIPPGFGRAVFGLAREPRELWMVSGADHLEAFDGEAERRRLIAYLETL